jgi:hypothetical protein
LKIRPAPLKTTQYIRARNIMPTLLYSGRDAAKRELWRPQSKINNFNPVTSGLPAL